MTNEAQILDAIDRLGANINGRIDRIEDRVAECEKRLAKRDERQKHRESAKEERPIIDREAAELLYQKMLELIDSGAVVHRYRDKHKLAIDREKAYKVFSGHGYENRDALAALDALGVLSRRKNDKRYTKIVQLADGSWKRAVVIICHGCRGQDKPREEPPCYLAECYGIHIPA